MKVNLIIISALTLLALCASAIAFAREKTIQAGLQLIGSIFIAVMAGTHFAETFHIFPQMGWGLPHTAGHYIDLASACVGVALFALGFFLRKLACRRV